MFKFLTAEEEGPKDGEHLALVQRESFSRWLPYLAYDPEKRCYHNSDNTVGFVWECRPLTFVPENALDSLTGVLRQNYPRDVVMQFIQYPDDVLERQLEEYLALKVREDPVSREAARRYADHLRAGTKGMNKMRGLPVRDFRLFVAAKSKTQLDDSMVSMLEESLAQAGLGPRRMEAGVLLEWLRGIFNARQPSNPRAYCTGRYLRSQIIEADSVVEHAAPGVLRLGGSYGACLTPKSLPGRPFDTLRMNRLLGGYMGTEDDGKQMLHRYIWTTTVFFHAKAADIKGDANLLTMQRAGGSIAKAIGRRVEELDWVLDDLENTPYVNIIMSMWVFGQDIEDLNRGVAKARNLWEAEDFVMQRETARGILQAMLLVALPFGLYMDSGNLTTIDRDFKVSAKAAATLLPVQGDFAGRMKPILPYIGRKGQLIGIDVFDKGANNYNLLVCADSGAGKSFQTNFLVNNYYGAGALIRCTDIGYSYEKQCHILKGRFIDVGDPSNKVVINPFLSLGGDEEDKAGNRQATANILLMMAFATTGVAGLSETHNTLMKDAVDFALERDGGELGVDHAYEYLSNYPKFCKEGALEGARERAHEMAFNLRDFCSKGVFGNLFNGKATFDISSDQFVVMELERLQNNPALFGVVSMQCMNAVTQDLYLSDRSTQRFMLFDEAWKYFGSSPLIAGIIYEGYRRARKYTGSTGIVTQSLLDLEKFGPAGEVIKANSAFKFLLESQDYEAAVKRGIIDYQGLLLELAKSVRNRKPLYSEILFITPYGAGIGRLCVDNWTYWMSTSSGDDFARYKQVVAKGHNPLEALNLLAAA